MMKVFALWFVLYVFSQESKILQENWNIQANC
jgi:hypothetical protein